MLSLLGVSVFGFATREMLVSQDEFGRVHLSILLEGVKKGWH